MSAGGARAALLAELAARLVRLATREPARPLRVGIDGVDAAGKTVLADELGGAIAVLGRPVVRASADGFHHPRAVRLRRGDLSPEGYYHDSFDHAALVGKLLAPLGPGGDRRIRRAAFDHRRDTPVEAPWEEAPPEAILVLDGVFLLRPTLRPHWDFTVFLRVGFDVTMARAERRDVALFGSTERVRERYARRYVPGQQLYLREASPEAHADLVIDNTDPAAPFVVWDRGPGRAGGAEAGPGD